MMELKKSTRVYIAGCGGMLGQAVYRVFSNRTTVMATDINLSEPWIEFADVRDFYQMRTSIKQFAPDVIINLAAMTDMEQCELNADNAWLTNALGAENLALLANEFSATYVYISTAGIFAGEKEFFNDFDTPNPLSIYAKSKFSGELFTREHVKKYFVIRAGWMMGGGPLKDKKFINKIYSQILSGSKTLYVVDDKLGTPTYTHDFAYGIARLLESGLFGVYNQTCKGSCSRYDVAAEFLMHLGLHDQIGIEKVTSDYFKTAYFAPRPESEKLLNTKLDARNLNFMRDWKVALSDYAQEYKEHFSLHKIESQCDVI